MSPLKVRKYNMKAHAKTILLLILPLFLYPLIEDSIPSRPDHCLLIGTDPSRSNLWQPNSRSLCLQEDICISETAFLRRKNTPATCSAVTTHLTPHKVSSERFNSEFISCSEFRRSRVTCAHGTGLIDNLPVCPPEQIESGRGAQWTNLAVIVPQYPFPANIYHYANVLTFVTFVLNNLHKLHVQTVNRVLIVMRGNRSRYGWQRGLLSALETQFFRTLPFSVEMQYLPHRNSTLCVRHALTLGFRGHVNVWPFTNDTEVALDGLSVPTEAIVVKESVLKASRLESIWTEHGRMQLPPRVIGYAKRLGPEQLFSTDATVRPGGTKRRFGPDDEIWFGTMIRAVADEYGMELREFVTRPEDTFQEQVRTVAGVGVLVGVHGANLVNGFFMRPFGAIVEVQPFGVRSSCYLGGGNSGLAYWGIEGLMDKGMACDTRELSCRLKYRQKEILLGMEEREKIEAGVRLAAQHVTGLHQRWKEGVPVRIERGRYVVDDYFSRS